MTAPAIDHIGIIVEDLEASAALMRKLLPGAESRRKSLPQVGLEVVEFMAANIIVELLQYTSEEAGLARQTMGDGIGFNHMSISVPDLDEALDNLAPEGIAPMSGFPMQGAHGRIAFLNLDARAPLRVELCQVDEAGHGGMSDDE